MGSSAFELLGALPIREQPTFPPESGITPVEVAIFSVLMLALGAVAGAVLLGRLRRRRLRNGLDEQRAWAAMDRLCREGWTAQLTLYGEEAPLPEDAPEVEGLRVRLDWAELRRGDQGDADVAVARRLWSRSVSGAMKAMIEDRHLDLELERIERDYARGDAPGGG